MGVSYKAAASIADALLMEVQDLQEVIDLRSKCEDSDIPQLQATYVETMYNLQTGIDRVRKLMRDAFVFEGLNDRR